MRSVRQYAAHTPAMREGPLQRVGKPATPSVVSESRGCAGQSF